MRKLFTSVLAGVVLATVASAQPSRSYNTELFGQLDPEQQSNERYSALTGWTAPNGREYALLGGPEGTHIIDITVAPIKQVSFIPGPHSGWREMKSFRSYGYVVSEGGHGLQIIDLSELPARATLVREDTTFFRTAHTITQEGNYIYVHGTNIDAGANGGTMIFDVATDPLHPALLGKWTGRYVHDGTIRNDTLYASAINNGQLDIVYLGKDRAHPSFVTSITYPGAGTHNSDLTPDGSYLMTTDEINSTPKTLKVWDVRDREDIAKVADWTPVPGEIIHNIHMKGSIAYIAWYSAGTRIVDMSNPLEPAELGYFDTYNGAANDYVGNWDVYPYFPSGKIIASDMQTGLYVFTFNNAQRGNVHGRILDAVTGLPLPGATVRLPGVNRTIVSDAQGRYSFSGATDTLEFSASALDYITGNGSLMLSGGEGTSRDILLTPLPLVTLNLVAVDAGTSADIGAFSYRVVERGSLAGRVDNGTQTLTLPQDSTYHVYVGAWGYKPLLVELHNITGELRVPLQRGYVDEVELDLGWSLTAPGDNAASGAWVRGVPVETFSGGVVYQPGEDHTPGDWDNMAFISGIANSDQGIGANDIDDGTTTLTSPPMDLASYGDPYISGWIWYSRDGNVTAIDDTLDILASGDNGANWSTLARITASTPRTWRHVSFRLKDHLTPGAATLFRVVASDRGTPSLVEAGFDDFSVVDSAALSSVPSPSGDAAMLGSTILRPNPFADQATLTVELGAAQHNARLELFDLRGERVASLYHGPIPAGETSFALRGEGLAPGRYTWRMIFDDGSIRSGAATVVR